MEANGGGISGKIILAARMLLFLCPQRSLKPRSLAVLGVTPGLLRGPL